MGFERITAPILAVNNITGLDDRPNLKAADLKARFDQAGGDLLTYLLELVKDLNMLIGALEDPASAQNLGASAIWPEDGSENSIQAKLEALKAYMDGLVIAAGAGDMLKNVYDKSDLGKVDTAQNAEKLGGIPASGYAREVAGRDAKTGLADGDAFLIADSADGDAQKKTFWSTLKSAMQTALANVFAAKTHGHGITDLTGVSGSQHTHGISSLSGVAAALHLHGAGDLSGVAKNTAGIRISVQSSAPLSPAVNDLWFADA